MSANLHIELNEAGVRELLQSAEMQSACMAQANAIASRAGEGHIADVRVGKNRAVARVTADTEKAIRASYETNNLLKALR